MWSSNPAPRTRTTTTPTIQKINLPKFLPLPGKQLSSLLHPNHDSLSSILGLVLAYLRHLHPAKLVQPDESMRASAHLLKLLLNDPLVSALPLGLNPSHDPRDRQVSSSGCGSVHSWKGEYRVAPCHSRVTIDVLPDDMLLKIFHFYANDKGARMTTWHTLVHICRRWRGIVFAYPHHLNLRLGYTGNMPWKKILDTWPDFPIVISDGGVLPRFDRCWSNIISALDSGYHDRICEIELSTIPDSHLEAIAAAMQRPFPVLTNLFLSPFSIKDDIKLVIPDSFSGGPTPRLHTIKLQRCSFPGMQKLLLSAKDLVTLSLHDIHISPDAMVTALLVMTRLKSLHLRFDSPRSRPDARSQRPPPLTRTILPALTQFTFTGVQEYSESLMAQIDAPLLENLSITFHTDLIVGVPQLHRFVSQIEVFKTFRRAKVFGSWGCMYCTLSPRVDPVESSMRLELIISCGRVDRQLSSLARVCSWSLPPISIVEELKVDIWSLSSSRPRGDDGEPRSTQWLELLGPFTAVKNLTLSSGSMSRVCDALKEIAGERVTEVLPVLENLFMFRYPPGDSRKAIKIFVTARRRSGHPVRVHGESGDGRWRDITKDLASGV